MEIQRLVAGAKLGDNDDFGALVKLYQHRLLATVEAIVRERAFAEDLVQEAFVRAWSGLGGLKNTEAFPAWLWSIARNLARSHCRSRSRNAGECADDPEDLADPRSFAEHEPGSSWVRVEQALKPDQWQLVQLRHGAGLSLRQIGAVLGIPEQRVKSRLFLVRQALRKAWGGTLPKEPSTFLEEKIMNKIETLRLGAHVFERLSLAAQTDLALAVLNEKAFREAALAEIGKADRGPEFLALFGTELKMAELVSILNHVDRFTEMRLIEHLENVAPAKAETLKRNFFVFEDIVLLDAKAVGLLHRNVDTEILAVALGGTELKVRRHVLDALAADLASGLAARIGLAEGDRKLVRAAQEDVVNLIKDLEQTGRLVFQATSPEGPVFSVGS